MHLRCLTTFYQQLSLKRNYEQSWWPIYAMIDASHKTGLSLYLFQARPVSSRIGQKYVLTMYVLCGLVGAVTLGAIVIYIVRRRSRLQEKLSSLVSTNPQKTSDEYQVGIGPWMFLSSPLGWRRWWQRWRGYELRRHICCECAAKRGNSSIFILKLYADWNGFAIWGQPHWRLTPIG